MSSNNAVILRKAQTYGPIVNGETMELVKRPYEYNDLQDGDIAIQTMCLPLTRTWYSIQLDRVDFSERQNP